jgi:hypothetical protein
MLAHQGVQRGYEVIAEYAVPAEERRKISIDLVWVKRRTAVAPTQNSKNHEYWALIAAFEIEGCDVPLPTKNRPYTEFTRHLLNFQVMRKLYEGDNPKTYVVLYTSAQDRKNPWPNYSAAKLKELVDKRISYNTGIPVIDGRDLRQQLTAGFGELPSLKI